MNFQVNQVHQKLRVRIMDEDLKPGEALVEREIGLEYQVSRTPVREALRQLVSEGLVVLDRGRGYSVRQLSVDDILELFVARESVEGMIAGLAAGHVDQGLTMRLAALRRQLEQVDVAVNPAEAVGIGRQLHDELAAAAENKILNEFYRRLRDITALSRNMSKKSTNVETISRQEHLQIVDAVIAGDQNGAERAMREHLRGTRERMLTEYLRHCAGMALPPLVPRSVTAQP